LSKAVGFDNSKNNNMVEGVARTLLGMGTKSIRIYSCGNQGFLDFVIKSEADLDKYEKELRNLRVWGFTKYFFKKVVIDVVGLYYPDDVSFFNIHQLDKKCNCGRHASFAINEIEKADKIITKSINLCVSCAQKLMSAVEVDELTLTINTKNEEDYTYQENTD